MAPPASSSAARNNAYASMTHCAWYTVAVRPRWIAGTATMATAPSMKARLEPRMEAASTQRFCAALQPGVQSKCRTAAWSHGRRIIERQRALGRRHGASQELEHPLAAVPRDRLVVAVGHVRAPNVHLAEVVEVLAVPAVRRLREQVPAHGCR